MSAKAGEWTRNLLWGRRCEKTGKRMMVEEEQFFRLSFRNNGWKAAYWRKPERSSMAPNINDAVSQMVGSIGRMAGEKEFFYCASVYIYDRMKVIKFY